MAAIKKRGLLAATTPGSVTSEEADVDALKVREAAAKYTRAELVAAIRHQDGEPSTDEMPAAKRAKVYPSQTQSSVVTTPSSRGSAGSARGKASAVEKESAASFIERVMTSQAAAEPLALEVANGGALTQNNDTDDEMPLNELVANATKRVRTAIAEGPPAPRSPAGDDFPMTPADDEDAAAPPAPAPPTADSADGLFAAATQDDDDDGGDGGDDDETVAQRAGTAPEEDAPEAAPVEAAPAAKPAKPAAKKAAAKKPAKAKAAAKKTEATPEAEFVEAPPKFAVNEKVMAVWDEKKKHEYYGATVNKVNADGTYDLTYDDGAHWNGAPTKFIRPVLA